MSNSNVSFVISAVDNASKILNEVTGNLKNMQERTQTFSQRVEANRDGIEAVGVASGIAFGGLSYLISQSVEASQNMTSSMTGLKSIVEGTGNDFNKAKGFIQDFTKDGILSTEQAATSLKNLLSRGFSIDESVVLMERLKDASAFGKQAALEWGDAVVGATEGLRQENSMLVDNAGITKNVAKMWEEYAKKIGVTTESLTLEQKREAEMQGILAESQFQVGDTAKALDGLTGAKARTSSATKTLMASIGAGLVPIMESIHKVIAPVIESLARWAQENPKLATGMLVFGVALAGVVTLFAGIALVLPAITSGLGIIGAVLGTLISPVGLVAGAIGALYLAFSTNFLGIRDITMSALESVKSVIASAWAYISSLWTNESIGLSTSVTALWEAIKNIFTLYTTVIKAVFDLYVGGLLRAWEQHGEQITSFIGALWEVIKSIFSTALNQIKTIFEGALTVLSGVVRVFGGIFTGDVTKIFEGVKLIITGVWNTIAELVRNAIYGLNEIFRTVFGIDVVATISGAWDSVTAKTQEAWNFVQEIVSSVSDAIKSKIDSVFALFDSLRNKAREVQSFVKSTLESFSGGGGGGVSGARAMGGSVESGKTYLVGERGPELFTPSFSGNITPNRKLGGGSTAINVNLGSVHIHNEADEDRLIAKMTSEITRKMELYNLGIA